MYALGALFADREGARPAIRGGGVGPAFDGIGDRATANAALSRNANLRALGSVARLITSQAGDLW
jgi:hypothetical protein